MRNALVALALSILVTACGTTAAQPPADGRPRVAVTVDANGYRPAEVAAPAGAAIQLVLTRTTDEGCGQQVVFPDLGIRRDLPLDTPVSIDLTMPATGSIAFTCGMGMMRGSVVAR